MEDSDYIEPHNTNSNYHDSEMKPPSDWTSGLSEMRAYELNY